MKENQYQKEQICEPFNSFIENKEDQSFEFFNYH